MVGSAPADPIAVGVGTVGAPDGAPETGHSRPTGSAVGSTPSLPVASLRSVRLTVGGRVALDDVDLGVVAGEIVGVAGVEGNGQRELALVLAGRLAPDAGSVRLPHGIGFIPQDRTTEGTIGEFDLTENVALALQRRPAYRSGTRLRWPALRAAAERIRSRYDVTAPSIATRVRSLSGGNQQRVVVGREIEMASELLVADNPTRGLDIAAAAFVHHELRELAASGVAVVLVSTDLDEVMALSDRVYAIARGRLTEVAPGRRTREGIGALMLGGASD
jgi:general nucleoside transport system ATP-binding protein